MDFFSLQLDSYKEDFRDERDEKNAIKIRFESQSAELRHLENKVRNTLLVQSIYCASVHAHL